MHILGDTCLPLISDIFFCNFCHRLKYFIITVLSQTDLGGTNKKSRWSESKNCGGRIFRHTSWRTRHALWRGTDKNCGGRIWTCDLQVMSLTSYPCSTPRSSVSFKIFRKTRDRPETILINISRRTIHSKQKNYFFSSSGTNWYTTSPSLMSPIFSRAIFSK